MKILIVGAGVVGSNLAEELSTAGHDVSVVDRDPELVRRLGERMDVMAVTGNAGQPSVLRRAGIEAAEMVVAVTDIDEVNLVICMIAEQFGVRHKIARLRNEEYAGPGATLDLSALGIDSVINPEELISETLLRILEIPGAYDVATFAEGKVLLVNFAITAEAPISGRKLAELREAAAMESFLVVAIFRGERAIIPRGDDQLLAGDHISVLVNADTLPLLIPMVQREVQHVTRVVLAGADRIGLRIAAQLERRLERVVLIEPEAARAEEAARALERTLVLRGEATDPDLLREADLERCQFFMALTRDDEYNLLSALMARRHGAPRVALLAYHPTYVPVLTSIGLDIVVNPRLVTVGEILRYIRKGPVQNITRLRESAAEVMELRAVAGSRVVGKPLMEIDFPEGAIVGALLHGDELVIPRGGTRIAEGDRVVVFALPEAIPRVGKLFSQRKLI